MAHIPYDRFLPYEELCAALRGLAAERPDVLELTSLGTSHEGRDIPLAILTRKATGPHTEKPALWADGNIHATELTASACVLYFIQDLLARDGTDAQATRILSEQTIYAVPRLNPDGAELCFAARPKHLRSSTRRYPHKDARDGIHREDLDGDGRILQMRIEDPTGDWKESAWDPRYLVKREPDEEGGRYFRLLAEGRYEGVYDGHLLDEARPEQSLDLNRNFPGAWRPEGEQYGAGPHPGSEPEARAVIDWHATHPNIFAAVTFHTFSRVIIRPYSSQDDEKMPQKDLWTFEAMGARGKELTGYPLVPCYKEFRYHPKETITGVFDDWLYGHKGIYAFTVELWDLPTAAGCEEKAKEKRYIDWFREHPLSDDKKILDFVKANCDQNLVAWYPYEHPQLGRVELGGFEEFRTWRNPPPALLEKEIAPHARFLQALAAMAPRLAFREVQVEAVGGGVFRVSAFVENRGYLPTYGSAQAKKVVPVEPIVIELELPEGAALKLGKRRAEVGHLEGRQAHAGKTSIWSYSPTDNRAKAEWLVAAPAGGELRLAAIGERAGTVRTSVRLA